MGENSIFVCIIITPALFSSNLEAVNFYNYKEKESTYNIS